jgi:hypothetical protein
MEASQPSQAPRARLISVGVFAAIGIVLGAVAVVAGSGNSSPSGLRVERQVLPGGGDGITVYVEDPSVNVADTANGRPNVELVCFDSRREVVVRATFPWPFSDTDGGVFEPHIHQTMRPQDADRVERCRLDGTKGPLEGRLGAS